MAKATAADRFYLRRIAPPNCCRFYQATVQRDLFGAWTVIREWGRIGSPGRVRIDAYASRDQAVLALGRLHQAKCRRGYDPLGQHPAAAADLTGRIKQQRPLGSTRRRASTAAGDRVENAAPSARE